MKRANVNMNMINTDVVNCVLLVVILGMVVYCLVKQKKRFDAHATTAAMQPPVVGPQGQQGQQGLTLSLNTVRQMSKIIWLIIKDTELLP